MDEHTITCNTETGRNREKVKNIKPIVPIKTPKGKMTRNSPAESPILLRREIPMAWGTTTDSLTPEINPFQYAIEIKYLTLKDQTSYLKGSKESAEGQGKSIQV